MIKVAIVEDDNVYAETLENHIRRFVNETKEAISIERFSDGVNFIEDDRGEFDIVFMDIAMPHMDGLETAKRLRARNEQVCLIFITTLAKYAIRGYEVNAFDFLVKPVEYDLFELKFKKAISYFRRNADKTLVINGVDGMHRVNYSDIMFVESDKHYIIYWIVDGEIRSRDTMKVVSKNLIDKGFAAIRNSTLVNLAHVNRFQGNEVIVGKEVLPVARSHKKEFLKALASWMGKEV